MCGIFGGAALTRPFLAETTSALRALAHRGPDGEGAVEIDNVVLGHRRLAIIDLSHEADQPLWDARRQVAIVFNGEIYNYRELRHECRASGLEFTTASDTEAIVNQYLLYGERSFDRLNGMFAFCLYDTRTRDAYLVRDPFGIKPLYYAPTNRGVLFASELQALLAIDDVDCAVDAAALQAYLQLDFVPSPYSIVRGARKLEGGSFLKIAAGGRYESKRYFVRRPFHSDDPAADFGRIIDKAVERHLISDVPLGVFLSGGIDSSIVAESARRVSRQPVATFSIAFDEATFDESKYFESVARMIGVNQHTRALGASSMIELVPRIGMLLGEPLADGSIYPTYLLANFAREHVTVALSGDGADELFAGYPTYFAHDVVRHFPAPLIRLLHGGRGAAHRLMPVQFENFSTDYKIKKFLDGLEPALVRRHVRWMGTFDRNDLPELLVRYDQEAEELLTALLLQPSLEADDGWLEKILRTDQRFYLQDGVLVKVDRASMASSLEVRVPFLDREMIAFADGLRADAKLRRSRSKVLLRQYAAGRFPQEIANRPKKGFGAPLGRWFRSELRPLLEEVLSPQRVESRGIFRPRYVQRLLEDHWSGRRDNRKQIFNLLSFTLWYDHFVAKESIARAHAA
ncbi:MAG TPA: asparagine synthase (glutamine-hydrolyzing) [Thermoanaerobaculia bacterium]|nr:asparagine synthase (glutamine-hydrolyzing) [Thermoanaerobaculia bacterium]